MVRHGLKHIFQKPTPDIDSSDRTQQLRSKTIYAGTVNLAQTLAQGSNQKYKTYNGPYEVAAHNLIASHSYDDMLSITKGKVLLNQLPLNSNSNPYYQKNFAKGQMYEGNYNQFDPSHNFVGHTGCNNSVLVYDIGTTGFTGPASYDTNGGFIGATGSQDNNKRIFIDPNHCYYSNPCLLDASYTKFVGPVLPGTTGPGQFNAQQIISADQYRGFSYPMSNFNLTCEQQILNQAIGPLFCPPEPPVNTAPPVISGNALVGSLLSVVSNGTWSNNPTSFTYQWYSGANPIPSQTTTSYTTQQADIGSAITCQVVAINAGGSIAPATSNSIVVVAPSIVAVGQGTNRIVYSSDGMTWLPSSNGNTIFTNGNGVAWNGSIWVAVGDPANTIATSSDGVTWTVSSSANTIFNGCSGVAWNGSIWVAVGAGTTNAIAISTDGINWTTTSISNNSIFEDGSGVAWNGSNQWVAVANGGGPNIIVYSPDGIIWSPSSNGNAMFAIGESVAWSSSLSIWVAVGNNGGGLYSIATSSDGNNWTASSNGNTIFTNTAVDVAWNGSIWVAVGNGTNSIATSSDGNIWTASSNGNTIITNGDGVAWSSSLSKWVAVGSGTNTIATSSDGSNWVPSSNGNSIFTSGNGVASK